MNCDLSSYEKQIEYFHVSLEGKIVLKATNTQRSNELNSFK